MICLSGLPSGILSGMATASAHDLLAYLERYCGGKGSGVTGPCAKGRDAAHKTMRAHANAAQAAAQQTAAKLKAAMDAHANANMATKAGAQAQAKLEDAQAAHDDASQKAARLAGKARELEHQRQVQERVKAAASAKRAGSGAAKPATAPVAAPVAPEPAAKAPAPEPAKQPAPAAPAQPATPKPAASAPGEHVAHVAGVYGRAAGANDAEIADAKQRLAGMSKADLQATARAIGHVTGASDSREKIAAGLGDRIDARRGSYARSNLRGVTDASVRDATPKPAGVPAEHVSHVVNAVNLHGRGSNLAPLEKVREHLVSQGLTTRDQQDNAINAARKQNLVSGSGLEGRQGTTPQQREAAITEDKGTQYENRIGYLSTRPAKHAEHFSEGGSQIRGAEIFTTGIHRGKEYTTADLDAMVENFNAYCSGPKPLMHVPAVLGHEEDQAFLERSDLPAAGWVSHLYREGNSLYADFAEVAPQVANLVKAHRYRTVSSEIYDSPPEGIPGNGKLLRRVAFLGADQPQIKAISDIPMPESHREQFASWRAVVLKFREAKPHKGGWVTCFAEVQPMDHDAMVQALTAKGMDPQIVGQLGDDEMAEMLRVMDAGEQPPAPMDDTMTPPPAPPEPAPMDETPAQFDDEDDDSDDPGSMEGAQRMGERAMKYLDRYGAGGAGCAPGAMPPRAMGDMTPAPSTGPAPQPGSLPGVGATPIGIPGHQHPKQVTMKYAEQMKAFERQMATLQKFQEDTLAAQKKARVQAELDALVQSGQVLPAQRQAGLDDVLYALPTDTLMKFSEVKSGKTVVVERSPFDQMLAVLKGGPILVRFGERVKSQAAVKVAAGSTADDAEVAKVERFAESNEPFQAALKAAGKTPAVYVEKFRELRKKDPELTAKRYGVPEGV